MIVLKLSGKILQGVLRPLEKTTAAKGLYIDIVIKMADNGGKVIILGNSTYREMAPFILDKTRTYRKLSIDFTVNLLCP